MARYRYLVADLISGVIREEMPFGNVTYGPQLNGSGSFSGTMGLYHPKATPANLAINRTSVYVERDNRIVWGGFINGTPVAPGENVTVNAIGYHNYFERRAIKVDRFYPHFDKFAIIQDLVNYAQSVTNGDIGVQVGEETSGRLVNLIIPAFERKMIGEIFAQLSSNSFGAGFDFAYEAGWEGEGESREVVKRLKLFSPYRGSVSGVSLVYGGNVESYTYAPDGSSQETSVDGIGPGEATQAIIFNATDPEGFAPVFDGVGSYKDVTSPQVLWWLTHVRLHALRKPKENFTLTTKPGAVQVGTFIEGDFVRAIVQDGPMVNVDGWYRIDNYRVNVSDEGEERITFTLLNPVSYYGS